MRENRFNQLFVSPVCLLLKLHLKWKRRRHSSSCPNHSSLLQAPFVLIFGQSLDNQQPRFIMLMIQPRRVLILLSFLHCIFIWLKLHSLLALFGQSLHHLQLPFFLFKIEFVLMLLQECIIMDSCWGCWSDWASRCGPLGLLLLVVWLTVLSYGLFARGVQPTLAKFKLRLGAGLIEIVQTSFKIVEHSFGGFGW